MGLRPGEVVIHDLNAYQYQDVQVAGEPKAKGLIPRNYALYPRGCYGSALAVDVPLIPRSEWPERIRDKVATQSQLSDIRLKGNGGNIIPALDQNGRGYCWIHSGTSCVMLMRAVANLPYVGLSAYAGACIIKNYRDEGGWGAQGLDFITARGIPSEKFWPMQSVSRANDNPATWANAALHKVTEGWIDLAEAQYDRNLTFDQVGSLLLANVPVVGDHNWWGHSIAHMDLVDGSQERSTTRMESGKQATLAEFEIIWGVNGVTAGFGTRILNSWGDSWSDRGMGVLAGSKAVPDGSVAPRVTGASPI